MEAARNAREAAPRSPAALSAELSDARLVALCRGGDEDAWSTLVERFSRYVYAIAVQAFRLPEHDAEDVFQEVFARDESYRAIGDALELPAGTIASRISRCLVKLREEIGPEARPENR